MCFSATASVTAGAALSGMGVVTIRKTKTKKELPFASLPLLFGIQQFAEGGVWLSLKYGLAPLGDVATYLFTFFAYVLWPVYVPLGVWLLEKDSYRKKILLGFIVLGAVFGAYLLSFMVAHGVSAAVACDSISYDWPTQHNILLAGIYIFIVCANCLFSSDRIVNAFGILVALSLMAAHYFYDIYLASTWCFFAAVLSILIFWRFWRAAR